jgi:hypothetical protein
MKWTKEKPNKNGYYWYSDDVADPEIVLLEWPYVWFYKEMCNEQIEYLDGEWSGPIPEPED